MACATLQTASMSITFIRGFVGVSIHTIFVLFLMEFSNKVRSQASINSGFTPNLSVTVRSNRLVPP